MKKTARSWICNCLSGIVPAVILFCSFVAALGFGSVEIPWSSVLEFLSGTADMSSPDAVILRELRFPRVLCAMLAGGAFAVSGAVLQGVLRNPLASPEITGVSAGGAVAGLTAMLFFSAGPHTTLFAVFSGALLTALAVYLLAWKNGVSPLRLILSGVAFSTLCGAVCSTMMYIASDKSSQILSFSLGSLAMRSAEDLTTVFPFAAAGFIMAWLLAKRLDILQLGDDTAHSLGVPVELSRTLLLFSSVLLAASGVSLAGLIGFAGLVVPHLVRLIFSCSDSRSLILKSAVFGAAFVTVCDTVGRSAASPIEIPAGVLTALAGPPFFLWLLFRKERIS